MRLRFLEKIGLLTALVLIAALDVFFYWNSHLYNRARAEEDPDQKINLLTKSIKFCPLNDLAFFELGKTHLDLGLTRIEDASAGASHFRKAVESLSRAILINPSSPYAHFYLAQSLLHLSILSPQGDAGVYEEFKKAALLAGDDVQILSEVGKLFFSRWPSLSEDDRRLTLYLLRMTMAKKNRDQIASILSVWALNVRDYEVIWDILPLDPQVYRMYADFLGENSLSLPERQKVLAQAEALDFESAQRESQLGEMDFFRFKLQEALAHFQKAQRLLEGIRFYQALTTKTLIPAADYSTVARSVWLNLAKCRIAGGAKLEEVEGDLRRYLALEDKPKEIGDLEEYLQDRALLPGQLSQNSADLGRLAFKLLLQFRQARYRDIVSFGRQMNKGLVIIPEDKKRDYIRILDLIGDSFQRVDYLYDAGDIYQKALDIEPQNLDTLLRMRQNSIRLNDDNTVRELEKAISRILTPNEVEFKESALPKGRAFAYPLNFDGTKVGLDIDIDSRGEGAVPMISVFFNGRVVWEDALRMRRISLNLETLPGENLLQIVPLNRAVSLAKLAWYHSDANQGSRP